MPDNRITYQTSLSAGSFTGQVKNQADQFTQRHTKAVYHTSETAAQIYQPLSFSSLLFFGAVVMALLVLSVGIALFIKRQIPVLNSRFAPRFETKRALPSNCYKLATSLLTQTEAAFYKELHIATGPLAVIQCEVRLADILLAPKGNLGAFRKVSQKHLDFLLCERVTLRPLLAVELDDPSHERLDRQARDRFIDGAYNSAGLPVIHIITQRQYNPAALLELIQPHLIS